MEEAQDLAMQIESGALPLDLQEIEVRSISATLGEGALQNSIFAGIVGLVILFAFILIYYRLPGSRLVWHLSFILCLFCFCLAVCRGYS
mgnify:CR=1 FL=1